MGSYFETDSIEAGSRTRGLLPLVIEGVSFDLPYFLIRGSAPGSRLVVTAGIHGGEYPCVEAAIRLGRIIRTEDLSGEVLIIPSANPTAFAARSIYVTPADGRNLNREFPGSESGTFTQKWAAWLFEHVISTADAYIDLHGGDMIEALVPFTACYAVENGGVTETSRLMAEAFGIEYALMHPKRSQGGPSGMAVLTAAEAGVPAILAEAGGQGVWHESDVELLVNGVLRVLHRLGMLGTDVAPHAERPVVLSGWSWLRAEAGGLYYPSVGVGDGVEKGQPLGRIADFFGETLQELHAPAHGIVLFLVTSLAINRGDPLLAVAYP